ncbi:MAG: hypothetical protein H6707_08505 [Deltaproteobacteria bacterium]|nr:hypothetical protein [Deltaproteobacteria bacterium]
MSLSPAPEALERLIEALKQRVTAHTGVTLDDTLETLPLVDAVLRDAADAETFADCRDLLIEAGAYFGELMRLHLNGRWAHANRGPEGWRIELAPCFLHFSPVGMVAEVLTGSEHEAYDGAFAALPELHGALNEMLDRAPPLPEDEYYSLSGRSEVLCMVTDWLIGCATTDDSLKKSYSDEDYRTRLG